MEKLKRNKVIKSWLSVPKSNQPLGMLLPLVSALKGYLEGEHIHCKIFLKYWQNMVVKDAKTSERAYDDTQN